MLKIKLLNEDRGIFSNYFKPFVITDEVIDLRVTLANAEAAKNLKSFLEGTDIMFHLDVTNGSSGRKEYVVSTVIDTKLAPWDKKQEYISQQILKLKDELNPLGYDVALDANDAYQKMIQQSNDDFQDEFGQGNDNSLNEDLLPGGKADDLEDDEFDSDSLEDAEKHEGEHTKNKKIAKEIAKDHLKEDPKYYDKLARVEKK